MIILYIIVFILILYILFKLFVRIKYKFWAIQPVFHYYNLFYWICPIGIIKEELPITNKYCNFININVSKYDERKEDEIKHIVEFIRKNYYRSNDINYLPTFESFKSYFIGNNIQPIISTYYMLPTYISERELVGTMTTRPLNITLKNKKTFICNYVDYLCVHFNYRKKNIAPEIIQTHEYIMRHTYKKHNVSLFKREGELMGIVPLTKYKSYLFNLSDISKLYNLNKINKLHASMNLIKINKLNSNLLINFILHQKSKFNCFVLPCIGNIINLILNNTITVYAIIFSQKLISCYFFRNSYMFYNKEHSIEVFASISDCNNDIFIYGFIDSLLKYLKEVNSLYITLENISHNNIIINKIRTYNILAKLKSPTAYFFYNYALKPLLPEKVFMLI